MDALWEVEGGAVLPAERMPETLMPSTSGKLEDLFPGENLEGSEDASQEWLSIFLEDCLSSTTTATFALSPLAQQKPPKSAIAEAGRSKRRRLSGGAAATADLLDIASDPPPLLSQGCWLAESELIVLKEEEKPEAEEAEEAEEEAPAAEDGRQAARRCSHCLSQRTPQWRAGPLGPKTLCNACGVRFKSGRLLPEYRPAKSPTFVSYKHSNSHKKVLEMRMATPSPSS